MIRYISLFSGIEAVSCALDHSKWEAVAFSEIDAFPCTVLEKRYPDVPNLGDITKIDWRKYVDTIDVVWGGSPCQSFSIAGKREGLDGASGLMWEYVRAVREIRPSFFVWENVPGALSSSHGEDFRCLLESMDDLGYGMARRVLDAQFFGVAQRRRRVFVVGSLGTMRCAEVLFEPESLCRDYPSGREKRKALTGRPQERSGTADGGYGECLTPWDCQSKRVYPTDSVWPTLYAAPKGGSINQVVYMCRGSQQANAVTEQELCPTITSAAGTSGNNTPIVYPKTMLVRCGKSGGGKGALIQDDMSATLSTSNIQTLFQPIVMADTQSNAPIDYDICGTLTAHTGREAPVVANHEKAGYTARRLTPVECERLQGFPDGWTDVPYKGKEHPADSARYKALGNSMAVPVMRWIGERIDAVL